MVRVLSLPGGGTRTIAAVADRLGAVLALRIGAGLDPTAGDGWMQRLADLVAPLGPIEAAAVGLPFHGERPAVSARQTDGTTLLPGPDTLVMNDVAVAFEASLAGSAGVLILAGTGSMAWARGPNDPDAQALMQRAAAHLSALAGGSVRLAGMMTSAAWFRRMCWLTCRRWRSSPTTAS